MLSESSSSTTWLVRPPLPSQCSSPVGLSTGRARKKNNNSSKQILSNKSRSCSNSIRRRFFWIVSLR